MSMMKDDERHYRNLVADILERMPGFGDTEECVAFVQKHDGQLKGYLDELAHVGLAEVVKQIMRSRRLTGTRNVPAFPSIEEDTGELDEQGNPIVQRRYASMKQLLLDRDWVRMDKIVDSQIKRVRSGKSICNATVRAGWLRGYTRELPFPEIDEGEAAAEEGSA